jgi:DNA polymerase-1
MKKLVLVDGSGFIFRAFHALPPLHTPQGVPVNAVYGFTKALLALQERGDIDYLAVVFDSSRLSFRQAIYKEYKAHRPPTPEELIPQFPMFRQVADALNIKRVEQEGFEADDLIATYSKIAMELGIAVEIQSSDKDLMQLISDDKNISMFDPLKKKAIKESEVLEKFGVSPDKVIYVQALMGDSSDNVPGVKGVGPKTATDLITTFGNLDNIYNNIDKISKASLKEKMLSCKELAYTSLKLVTLEQQVPVEGGLDGFIKNKFDPKTLYTFLNSLSFNSLALKIAKETNLDIIKTPVEDEFNIHQSSNNLSPVKTKNKVVFETVEIKTLSQDTFKNLKLNRRLPILLQNNTLNILDELGQKEYQLKINNNLGKDLFADQEEGFTLNEILINIKDALQATHIQKIFHNAKEILNKCIVLDIHLSSYEDTYLLSYLLNGSKEESQSLKIALVQEFLFAEEDTTTSIKASDLLDLFEIYENTIVNEHCKYVYECIDKPLVATLIQMENFGIMVNKNILIELGQKFTQEIKALEEKIFNISKEEFNLASPKQIGEVLFNKLEIKGKKNKTGSWKTSASFLEDLAEDGVEIANLILQWRQYFKLKTTYTDSLIEKINPHTGRIHSKFLQCQTTTGRLSSIDPNLQNIPIRTQNGKEIRKAFVAKEGYKIISLDYSQIELRVLAIIAQVNNLLDAFKHNQDIHKKTASEIFNVPLAEVTDSLRRNAKAINFGIIYGQSEHGLASLLGISKVEAKNYIDSYFKQYPEIKEYMEKTLEIARKQGYVTTLLGRKCFVKDINHKNYTLRSFAERTAINARIQGTSADIMRKAMVLVDKFLRNNSDYDANIALQIHDELLVEVKETQAAELARTLQVIMEQVFSFPIVLEVNYSIADNWHEAH